MQDAVMATFWGSLEGKKIFAAAGHGLHTEAIESPYFAVGHINVLLRQLPHKADLVIFVPGIFNGLAHSSSSLRGWSYFSERDYHVAVIPNPWSHDYVALSPSFVPGEVLDEVNAFLQTVDGLVKRIGPENIASVNLVGESYGGFLSAAATAFDAESSHPLVDGSVTLISPPLNLPTSRHRFDALMAESAPLRGKCTKILTELKIVKIMGNASRPSQLSAKERACVPAILAYTGMQKALRNMAEDLMGEGLVDPSLKKIFNKRRLRELTFQEHADNFTRGITRVFPDDHPVNGLVYWVERAQEAKFDRIRVIGAVDDIANDPKDWDGLARVLGPEKLILLPEGGHMGFESLPWFEDFLDSSFMPRAP